MKNEGNLDLSSLKAFQNKSQVESAFSLKHFGHFLLRHFGHWYISVICLTVVLKLTITVFLAYIFKHWDRNDLIFFGHFKDVSVYDRKKTDLNAFVCYVPVIERMKFETNLVF